MDIGKELEHWNDDDFRQMKKLEVELIEFLIPRIQNLNPLLALYTLIRCARVMLRKGDDEAQKALLPVIFAYLAGSTKPQGAQSSLWTPFSSRVN